VMRRGEMSVGEKIDCLMAISDKDTKERCVYEQHDHLYT